MQRATDLQKESGDRVVFLQEFFRHPLQIGSVIPSSPFLERRIVRMAEIGSASSIVELGSGTGGTTRAMLGAMAPGSRLLTVEINEHFSWGLGIGIQHSAWGDALWQNGNTFGFKSVIVIYPVQNWGVVVLTNGHEGQGLAYDIAHRALGGEAFWKDF